MNAKSAPIVTDGSTVAAQRHTGRGLRNPRPLGWADATHWSESFLALLSTHNLARASGPGLMVSRRRLLKERVWMRTH
jgi:hypothetical protein